ncbi:MAG: glucokinase [Reyranellaceae bacterium]
MSDALLADIGGTHARFALLRGGDLQPVESLDVARHATPEAAIRQFLSHLPADVRLERAVLAAAGPVVDNRCRLTNGTWLLDGRALAAAFGLAEARIVNDLEALAWAIPHLAPGDIRGLGGAGQPAPDAPMAVVAPGTGLGMACWVGGAGGRVLTSEGGHASLAANDEPEAAVVAVLRRRFGHVSAERVLSGQGLENLLAALAEIDGVAAAPRPAPEITRAALDDSDPRCRRALELFCGFLGGVAGDAALVYGARGGVYLGGGIVPGLVDFLARSAFRARFEGKGRLASYAAAIPTAVIVRPDPAFLGLRGLALRSDRHDG